MAIRRERRGTCGVLQPSNTLQGDYPRIKTKETEAGALVVLRRAMGYNGRVRFVDWADSSWKRWV